MDLFGPKPDEQDPAYPAFQARCRREFATYIQSIADRDYPVAALLPLMAAHIEQAGNGGQCQASHDNPDVLALSTQERRTLVGMQAAFHAIGGYSALDMMGFTTRDQAWIPGLLATRMMVTTPYTDLDFAYSDRLVETLLAPEIMWLICTAAGILAGADMTPQMIRELDPQWTLDPA